MDQQPPKNNLSTPAASTDQQLDFMGHLAELRGRLLWILAAVVVGAVICYSYSFEIFRFLSQPFHQAFDKSLLIGTGPAEAFMIKLKVSAFAGAILATPIIFQQIWSFISPGLYEHERKMVIPFILATTSLFVGGVAFCYYVVFPFAFQFFSEQYISIGITPTVRISEHLSLVLQGLIGFGLVFELPVLAFLLGRLGVIDDQTLIRYWRYAIVIIFIVSAIMTPPDVLTQFLMAVPLLLLYALSIWVVKVTARSRTENEPDR